VLHDLLLKFLDPIHFSGTVGARNFKFGWLIDHQGHQWKRCKIRSKGWGRGHVAYFWNFGSPSISCERRSERDHV